MSKRSSILICCQKCRHLRSFLGKIDFFWNLAGVKHLTNSMSVIRGQEGVEMKGLNNKEVEEVRFFLKLVKEKFIVNFSTFNEMARSFFVNAGIYCYF